MHWPEVTSGLSEWPTGVVAAIPSGSVSARAQDEVVKGAAAQAGAARDAVQVAQIPAAESTPVPALGR